MLCLAQHEEGTQAAVFYCLSKGHSPLPVLQTLASLPFCPQTTPLPEQGLCNMTGIVLLPAPSPSVVAHCPLDNVLSSQSLSVGVGHPVSTHSHCTEKKTEAQRRSYSEAGATLEQE